MVMLYHALWCTLLQKIVHVPFGALGNPFFDFAVFGAVAHLGYLAAVSVPRLVAISFTQDRVTSKACSHSQLCSSSGALIGLSKTTHYRGTLMCVCSFTCIWKCIELKSLLKKVIICCYRKHLKVLIVPR